MTSKELADRIAQLLLDKKGNDVVMMDLRGISDVADYFIIVSGESDIHVKTLANHVEKELKGEKIRPLHKEGFRQLNWVLMDFIEVVVHIFRPEVRNYFALEKLWADAKFTKVEDHVTARVVSESAN